MIAVSSFLIGLSFILLGVYVVLELEYGRGISSRLRYVDNVTKRIIKMQGNLEDILADFLMEKLELMERPSKKDKQQGYMVFFASSAIVAIVIITHGSFNILLMGLLLMAVGIVNPYLIQRGKEKKFKQDIETEVPEMIEMFSFCLAAGNTIEKSLEITADSIEGELKPYMERLVANMLVQSKEESINILGEELSFNQNMVIFSSALNQAIKGYEDTLNNFVTMQSKLHNQLTNEKVEKLIMTMPTKLGAVAALMAGAVIIFLIFPIASNVLNGLDIYVGK